MKPRRISCSMLPAFNGPLCDAVTERHDSALLLEAVERAGLFLEAVDGPSILFK